MLNRAFLRRLFAGYRSRLRSRGVRETTIGKNSVNSQELDVLIIDWKMSPQLDLAHRAHEKFPANKRNNEQMNYLTATPDGVISFI